MSFVAYDVTTSFPGLLHWNVVMMHHYGVVIGGPLIVTTSYCSAEAAIVFLCGVNLEFSIAMIPQSVVPAY